MKLARKGILHAIGERSIWAKLARGLAGIKRRMVNWPNNTPFPAPSDEKSDRGIYSLDVPTLKRLHRVFSDPKKAPKFPTIKTEDEKKRKFSSRFLIANLLTRLLH